MRDAAAKKEYLRQWRLRHLATITPEQLEAERVRTRERQNARYRAMSPEARSEIAKRHRDAHADRRRQNCREWRARNQERVKEYNRQWHERNRQRALDLNRKWRAENRELRNAALRDRFHSDIRYRIETVLRNRFQMVLRRRRLYDTKSDGLAKRLVGCSIDALMEHLESKFQGGMSWDNFGDWHIDHIKPCAVFDLTDIEQQRECFHFSNLQPLWKTENLRKGAKLL